MRKPSPNLMPLSNYYRASEIFDSTPSGRIIFAEFLIKIAPANEKNL